jgi:hypothetical protein
VNLPRDPLSLRTICGFPAGQVHDWNDCRWLGRGVDKPGAVQILLRRRAPSAPATKCLAVRVAASAAAERRERTGRQGDPTVR